MEVNTVYFKLNAFCWFIFSIAELGDSKFAYLMSFKDIILNSSANEENRSHLIKNLKGIEMEWKKLLHGTFEYQYAAADNLIGLAENDKLDWKPATGSNWMTLGQLLHHISNACGMPCKGFATGDWGIAVRSPLSSNGNAPEPA